LCALASIASIFFLKEGKRFLSSGKFEKIHAQIRGINTLYVYIYYQQVLVYYSYYRDKSRTNRLVLLQIPEMAMRIYPLPTDIRYMLRGDYMEAKRDFQFTLYLVGHTLKSQTEELIAGLDERARTIVLMVGRRVEICVRSLHAQVHAPMLPYSGSPRSTNSEVYLWLEPSSLQQEQLTMAVCFGTGGETTSL
jgi:hypothetical protein